MSELKTFEDLCESLEIYPSEQEEINLRKIYMEASKQTIEYVIGDVQNLPHQKYLHFGRTTKVQ
jgi:hypothetical protein